MQLVSQGRTDRHALELVPPKHHFNCRSDRTRQTHHDGTRVVVRRLTVHGDDGIDPPDEASQDGVAALGSRGAQAAVLDGRGSRHARRGGRASVVVATTGVRGGGDGGASASLASVLPGLLAEAMAPLQSKIDALGAELRASNERVDALLLGPPHDVAAQANARHSPLHRMLSENGAIRQVFREKIIRTRLMLIDADMFAEVSRVCRDVVTEALPVKQHDIIPGRKSPPKIGARLTLTWNAFGDVVRDDFRSTLFKYPARLQWAMERKFPLRLNEDDIITMALCGCVETLEWARQKSLIDVYSPKACKGAGQDGHLRMLRNLIAGGCPMDGSEIAKVAASKGQLEILRWLKEQDCPWDKWTPLQAALYGHLETLQYLLDRPGDDALNVVWSNQVVLGDLVVECFRYALKHANFDVLQWIAERYDLPHLMEHSDYGFSLDMAVKLAIQLGYVKVVQWMVSELGATLPVRACALTVPNWQEHMVGEDRPVCVSHASLCKPWQPEHWYRHSYEGMSLWIRKKGCGCPRGCPPRRPRAWDEWEFEEYTEAHAHMWATARAVARGDKEWEWTDGDYDASYNELYRVGDEVTEDEDYDAKFAACYASLSC